MGNARLRSTILEGHTGWVDFESLSVKRTLIVCVLRENSMQVWKKGYLVCMIAVLSGHTKWARCVAMSVNSTQVASKCREVALQLWMYPDMG